MAHSDPAEEEISSHDIRPKTPGKGTATGCPHEPDDAEGYVDLSRWMEGRAVRWRIEWSTGRAATDAPPAPCED